VSTAAFAAARRNERTLNDNVGLVTVMIFLVLSVLSFSALMTLFAAVAPQLVRRSAAQVVLRRRTAFWLGLVAFGVAAMFLAGAAAFSAAGGGVFSLFFVLLSFVVFFIYVVGYSGVAYHLGTQILACENASEAAATGIGTLTIAFTSLIPFIGWVIGFYAVCLSIGVFPFAWFSADALPARDVGVEPTGSGDLPR